MRGRFRVSRVSGRSIRAEDSLQPWASETAERGDAKCRSDNRAAGGEVPSSPDS